MSVPLSEAQNATVQSNGSAFEQIEKANRGLLQIIYNHKSYNRNRKYAGGFSRIVDGTSRL